MPRYTVHVKPGSTKGPLVEIIDERALRVFVRERAVDGAANDGVVKALAEHFGVPRSRIAVVRGHTGRLKLVDVSG